MTCKNCGANVVETANFCPNCGAKYISKRLSVKAIVVDFIMRLANFDGPVWLTVRDLTLRPYEVTDGYITGLRKKYIPPMRYLLIAITISGVLMFFFSGNLDEYYMAAYSTGAELGSGTPNNKVIEFQQKYQSLMQAYQKNMNLIGYAILPVMALFTFWMLRKKNQYNFAEHLVANSYVYAHSTVLGSAFGLAIFWVTDSMSFWLGFSSIFSLVLLSWFISKSLKSNIFMSMLTVLISYLVFMIVFMILLIIVALII